MNKQSNISIIMLLVVIIGCTKNGTSPKVDEDPIDENYVFDRWASSENFEITINSSMGDRIVLTSGYVDYKPSWSLDGSMITFFRLWNNSRLPIEEWRTSICVANVDGSGVRELTSGDFTDTNPTWTRDGSNMVLFHRYSSEPELRMKAYMISPDGSPGDEVLLSDPSFTYHEWPFSGLRDGRVFVDVTGSGIWRTCLLTPSPGQRGTYEDIARPMPFNWHKVSLSPSETKVAYMMYDPGSRPWEDAVICYADFDVDTRVMSNQVIVTASNPACIFKYPRWTKDERYLIYDSNISGRYQIYAYRLADGHVQRISPDLNRDYMFATFDGVPK